MLQIKYRFQIFSVYFFSRPIYFLPGINTDAKIMITGEDYDVDDDHDISAEIKINQVRRREKNIAAISQHFFHESFFSQDLPLNDLPAVEAEKMGDLKICIENFMGMDDPLCADGEEDYAFGGSYDIFLTYSGTGTEAVSALTRKLKEGVEKLYLSMFSSRILTSSARTSRW